MRKYGGPKKDTLRITAVLTSAVLALFLGGCGIKPHELLGLDKHLSYETIAPGSNEVVPETMQNQMPDAQDGDGVSSETERAVSEVLPFPRDTEPGQILSQEALETADIDSYFWQSGISDEIFARMDGKSYKEECNLRDQLRYIQILHYDFDGNVRVGELVSNELISDDLLYVFRQLFDCQYPIEKVILIDEYDADDKLSSSDNNTSCFNYRSTTDGNGLSKHARGVAIDINPLYNPYITSDRGSCVPALGAAYMRRDRDFPHKIDENDQCYKLFVEAGFTWGGSWSSTPDYMHFEKLRK